MHHQSDLIALIAMGFVLALAFGYLAAKLRMPPLVGYLIAGIAIGPFTPGFVADSGLAGQLAEIGVILLMFGVGLHFSIDSLLKVRAIALPGAVVQIAVATAIGWGLASWLGWSTSAGIVFGLAMSVASTVVLLRALEQRNEVDTEQGRIAVGWLIVEDLAMVLALVFLPALSPSHADPNAGASGLMMSLGFTTLKVALFVAIMMVGGRRVVPWILGQVARTGSRELFTLAVLAIALGIAYGSAVLFDVSFALGAFFAGVMLAESDLSHQAAENSLPLQDAFAVMFFVSVGMLFDPSVILRQPLQLLGVMFIILIGKSLAAFAIVLAFGYAIRTALTISASLAQIGEFSFILAGLGVALGLLPEAGRDLILAGALLSITLNPLAFATIEPVARWFNDRPRLMALITRKSERQAVLPPDGDASHLRNHAVIVGYGRVGSVVGHGLQTVGLEFIVVETNRRVVDRLREDKIAAIYGDASANGVLELAHIQRARLLVIATPDGFHARRILELARAKNPKIAIVVRTHSSEELQYLIRQGVDRAVMGELELALEMTDYALRSLGVSEERCKLLTQRLRNEGAGGAAQDTAT
jgi:CPA2 family monovalent cation:H+ antiporter-2